MPLFSNDVVFYSEDTGALDFSFTIFFVLVTADSSIANSCSVLSDLVV